MIKKILSMFCAAALVSGLAACASTDEAVPQKYNEPRFNADGIVNLKVNKVEVVSEFTPSFTRPNVEHLFPVSIEKTAKLSVVLKVNDPYNFSSAETSLEAWRELTIPVDTSIEDKERYWNSMVEKLFEEFNARMQININKYLNMYVADSEYIQDYDK